MGRRSERQLRGRYSLPPESQNQALSQLSAACR
jgi:hypothetical protein